MNLIIVIETLQNETHREERCLIEFTNEVRASNKLTQKLRVKIKEWDALENKHFEKPPHVPGNLEGQIHAQSWAHSQKRPQKALSNHLWLTFRLCASRKWEVRQSCKLAKFWKRAPSNTYKAHLQKLEYIYNQDMYV